jgi:hypothetical protein
VSKPRWRDLRPRVLLEDASVLLVWMTDLPFVCLCVWIDRGVLGSLEMRKQGTVTLFKQREAQVARPHCDVRLVNLSRLAHISQILNFFRRLSVLGSGEHRERAIVVAATEQILVRSQVIDHLATHGSTGLGIWHAGLAWVPICVRAGRTP